MNAPYVPGPIKRARATRAEMEERADALLAIVREIKPCTIRGSFYQATVHGIVEKTEAGYAKVQRMLAALRLEGALPWHWITDNTRWQRKPTTWDSLRDAVEATAQTYRRSLWSSADAYVEIWLEKDALAGVLYPVTERWDVPLMVTRGYSSLTFLNGAASYIAELGKPAYLYHFGDFDPSGQDAAAKIPRDLRKLAPHAEIHFEQVAVRPWQIEEWRLPTRLTKDSDSRAKSWTGGESVELDAINANVLRQLCDGAIRRHVDPRQLRALEVAEQSERELLTRLGALAVEARL
jgi:hypothetical protein